MYYWANSSKNVVHSLLMLSVSGFNSSKAVPTFFTHPVTFLPCIRVKARFIFCIADLNPGTRRFRQTYVFIASTKCLALAHSPVKGSRSAPIILTSPCGWGTCCGAAAGPWGDGGHPPPPLPTGFPPGPPPPGFLFMPLFQACLMLWLGSYAAPVVVVCTAIVGAVIV